MTATTLRSALRLPPWLASMAPPAAPAAAVLAALAAALIAALAAVLAGCATVLPKLEAPSLVVTGVVIGGGNMQQQQIRLSFHAANPNDRAIPVRSIDCNLELQGTAFAQGVTDAPFTLPPLGEADFDVNVTANLNAVLAALAGGLGHHTVDYRVYGKVHLQGGLLRTIPFDQKGRLRL